MNHHHDTDPTRRMSDDEWARDVAANELIAAGVIAARAYVRGDEREVFDLIRHHDARTIVFSLLSLVVPMGERLFASAAEMDAWLGDRLVDLRTGQGPGDQAA